MYDGEEEAMGCMVHIARFDWTWKIASWTECSHACCWDVDICVVLIRNFCIVRMASLICNSALAGFWQ